MATTFTQKNKLKTDISISQFDMKISMLLYITYFDALLYAQ